MSGQHPPETEMWQRNVYACPACQQPRTEVPVRSPTKVLTCETCEARRAFEATPTQLTQEEALAVLVAEKLRSIPVVVDAEAERDIIRCWVSEDGVHLGNITNDVDIEVHEVGSRDAYERAADEWPWNAEAFFNGVVRGLRVGWKGSAFPVYTMKRNGVAPAPSIPEDLRRVAEIAGVLPE